MAEWKINIKRLAEDFYISQIKVNRILKKIEDVYSNSKLPMFYEGNREEFLYDKAQKEIMNIVFA